MNYAKLLNTNSFLLSVGRGELGHALDSTVQVYDIERVRFAVVLSFHFRIFLLNLICVRLWRCLWALCEHLIDDCQGDIYS